MKQYSNANVWRPFQLLSRYGQSRPLASRPSAFRASANDAFALVYVPDSNRFVQTPTRRFYFFSDHFCDIAPVDSDFLKNRKSAV